MHGRTEDAARLLRTAECLQQEGLWQSFIEVMERIAGYYALTPDQVEDFATLQECALRFGAGMSLRTIAQLPRPLEIGSTALLMRARPMRRRRLQRLQVVKLPPNVLRFRSTPTKPAETKSGLEPLLIGAEAAMRGGQVSAASHLVKRAFNEVVTDDDQYRVERLSRRLLQQIERQIAGDAEAPVGD